MFHTQPESIIVDAQNNRWGFRLQALFPHPTTPPPPVTLTCRLIIVLEWKSLNTDLDLTLQIFGSGLKEAGGEVGRKNAGAFSFQIPNWCILFRWEQYLSL